MEHLFVRNFRCFKNIPTVELRPLTILVGENSSGKSAFLAAARMAWDIRHGQLSIDFNENPFQLGSYDQIAHYRGGKAGRAKTFEIGTEVSIPSEREQETQSRAGVTLRALAAFRAGVSEPELSKLDFSFGKNKITFIFSEDGSDVSVTIANARNTASIKFSEFESSINVRRMLQSDFPFTYLAVDRLAYDRYISEKLHESLRTTLSQLQELFMSIHLGDNDRPHAFAPVRTKPQRTYNPLADVPEPEGGHVPMLLAKLYIEDYHEWQRIQNTLQDFGSECGLFNEVNIKRLGRKGADPFQVQVQVFGRPSNLIDVGYGVSQALPVLVDTIRAPDNSCFLLQQPEVHLHPRAQSQIGSFLADLVALKGHKFVVETHSDYLIDRIRADVRDKNSVSSKDVAILFFERRKMDVQVHTIDIDEQGNLLNAPEQYGRFFLEEQQKILGIR